jgi:hypothetical protein
VRADGKKAVISHDIEKPYDVVMNQVTVLRTKIDSVLCFGGFLEDEREEKDLVPLHAQRSALADGRRVR